MAQSYNVGEHSAGTDGKGIKVVATATAGTLIHTAIAGTDVDDWDEIEIIAYNDHTSAITLTLEWGGVTVPDNIKTFVIPPKTELVVVVGQRMQNGLTVAAFASVANLIVIYGGIIKVRSA